MRVGGGDGGSRSVDLEEFALPRVKLHQPFLAPVVQAVEVFLEDLCVGDAVDCSVEIAQVLNARDFHIVDVAGRNLCPRGPM